MNWFFLGWHYGLVGIGIITALIAFVTLVVLAVGLFGMLVGILTKGDEDDE